MLAGLPPNIMGSLLFGAIQVIGGGGLVWYGLASGRWRQWRSFIAALAGVWFFVSGVAELLVSGMEASRLLTGAPGLAVFTAWRSGADTALFSVTGVLALVALAYGLMMWWASWRSAPAKEDRGARGGDMESERGE